MSGVLAIVSTGAPTGAATRQAMLGALAARGRAFAGAAESGAAVIAATCHEWERPTGDDSGEATGARSAAGAGAPLLHDGALLVAADATLYHRADLLRALAARGFRPHGSSPAHIIAAAYRAWGVGCPRYLEGDFAFVLWDAAVQTLLAARDFAGRRPLFHAALDGTHVVASTLHTLRAHERCSGALDVAAIAMHAGGLFAAADVTPYAGIAELPAGHSLTIHRGAVSISRHWEPPPVREARGPSFDDAAAELRDLLAACTRERLAPAERTSIWLSGGWDSSAVLGAGVHALGGEDARHRMSAVSIGFPEGDPGREDELIEQLSAHTGVPVHWLSIRDIPLLESPLERASARGAPFAHPFEMGNHALALGSRATGARVALDGVGGDQLFQVSNVFMADLLRTGRFLSLARSVRRAGLHRSSRRHLLRTVVHPLLPAPLRHLARSVRGPRSLRGYLERTLPDWFDSDFARLHALEEREAAAVPRPTGRDRAANEMRWYLSYAYFPRAFCAVADIALEHGVELRSPLYDRRIVEFAATRPRSERADGRETKRLLRHAMRGLLPESFLAPRAHRTGTAGAYFTRELRQVHAPWLTALLAEPLHLEELGIVRGQVLRRSWDDFVRGHHGALGIGLLLTIQTELWLRTHIALDRAPHTPGCHGAPAHDCGQRDSPPHGQAVLHPGVATRHPALQEERI